jgi:hypothetical protein
MTITIERQIQCVKREIGMRERVYTWRVSGGYMSQTQAEDEISAMKAVLATLEEVAAGGVQKELL